MMMNYTFKTLKGEVKTVRACDAEQARVVAMVKYGNDFLRADIVKVNNSL